MIWNIFSLCYVRSKTSLHLEKTIQQGVLSTFSRENKLLDRETEEGGQ